MKKVIIIGFILLVLIVGIYFYKKYTKTPEQLEAERLDKVYAAANAKIKAIEESNKGKTLIETGGRSGAVRTSNSVTVEQWNELIRTNIITAEGIIKDYKIEFDNLTAKITEGISKYGIYAWPVSPEFKALSNLLSTLQIKITESNKILSDLKTQLK